MTSRVRQILIDGALVGKKMWRDWLVSKDSAKAYRDSERKPGRKASTLIVPPPESQPE